MTLKTFAPTSAATAAIAATTTSAAVNLDAYSNAVRVVNAGPNFAFLKFQTQAAPVDATLTDMPLAPGATETFTIGSADRVAAICATGTAALYFTNGEGL